MSLFKFLRNAGEKLLGGASEQTAPATPSPTVNPAPAAPGGGSSPMSERAAQSIADYIRKLGLPVQDLKLTFDGPTGTVEVHGEVPDQATREKVVLACGNIDGVEVVRDELRVAQATVPAAPAAAQAAAPSRMVTVNRGDTLSQIAKQMYGDPNQYMKIFEANKPMLKDPDKIYPGQVLRVPA